MPKIEVHRPTFVKLLGAPKITDDELERIFPAAKAELDEPAGPDGMMKVELNDTNRPDLWSTTGLARALRLYRGEAIPRYDFFSDAETTLDSGDRRVVVDQALRAIRPYIVGFVMSGPPLTDALLDDLIQTQEKLTWNYGQKRRAIAMGVYRSDLIRWPVRYRAVDPDTTQFEPLQMEGAAISMRRIVEDHPKGREFGHIHEHEVQWPLLTDDTGGVLSFPPVINSARIGAVETGDRTLFVELTGTDLGALLHAASIVACDVSDAGYEILPVRIEYPFDTPMGRTITVPYRFQPARRASMPLLRRLLGVELSGDQIIAALARVGVAARSVERVADGPPHAIAEAAGPTLDAPGVEVIVPPYRNDFLHAVDIGEDVMIGLGMDFFQPRLPDDFTPGGYTPIEEYSRTVKGLMVGLGYQEMLFTYLGSARDYVDRMYPEEARERVFGEIVQIANPMSENYEFVRPSVLPALLNAESGSGNAVYPHSIFEIGRIARRDEQDVSGTVTMTGFGALVADRDADFNLLNSHLSALLYYLGRGYSLVETEDPRFIAGRVAEVRVSGSGGESRRCGVFGEIHPRVLDAWGIQVPSVALELELEVLMGDGRRSG